ncbi:tripartite tricarboxylate transporter TctB family protein [Salibacterium salarium]|uniref:Tripartite tricarboxylate transporter TctB family protein n=1 Tax=Salibacterium salarium TaxID=284579 RepID=A0A3R9P6T6_9BACI|nr:tripartite tricarboxylate transporter TctB family protein [Salibacterium salarium]RSL32470.1 tripartite tricarboxylate transporter TctB family protein [Salibacterium salarium]
MLKPIHRKVSLILIALAVFYLYLAFQLKNFGNSPIGTDTMPKALGFLLILLSILLFFTKDKETEEEKKKRHIPKDDVIKILGVLIITFGYIFFLERLGFILVSFLFIYSCSLFLGYQKHITNFIVSFVFPTVLYSVFTILLGINLPSGIIPF